MVKSKLTENAAATLTSSLNNKNAAYSKNLAITSINSHDGIRYIWLNWRIIGMNPIKNYQCLYWLYALLVNIAFTILHPIHLIVQIFFTVELQKIIANLSVSITLCAASIKQLTVFKFTRNELQQLKVHFKILDQRTENRVDELKILQQAIQKCHRTYFVSTVAFYCSQAMFAISGYIRHAMLFDGWFPFDWSNSTKLYAAGYMYQMIGCVVQIFQNVANDLSGPTYLIMLKAHFEVLNLRVSKLGFEPNQNLQHNLEELKRCIEDHKQILK